MIASPGPRLRSRALPAAVIVVAALSLVACSSSSSNRSAPSSRPAASSASPSATADASTPPPATGIALPLEWQSDSLRQTGAGYVLRLSETSRPDVYDGRLFHRDTDGAVSGQVFVTVKVTSGSSADVRFSGSAPQAAALTGVDDGSAEASIALGPGCVAVLVSGASAADCTLYSGPAASATPTGDATPAAPPPTFDEAMGYFCTTSTDELPDVTRRTADPYATAVLQAALTSVGFDPGPIDGVFGKTTRGAVRDFQASAGLEVDGLVGPLTWSGLQAAACQVPVDPAE